jgi:hypothetical protein
MKGQVVNILGLVDPMVCLYSPLQSQAKSPSMAEIAVVVFQYDFLSMDPEI